MGAEPTLERRTIPADGVDLACWHRPGDGTRWVLFLHGAGGNHRLWGPQAGILPGHDLLFLDVRGQGESVLPPGHRVSLRRIIDDLPVVLDAYGAADAVLVGHSWGGNPAQELAYEQPERVRALVFVGSWGQHREMKPSEARMIRVAARVYRIVPWGWVAWLGGRTATKVPATRIAVADAVRSTDREVWLDLGLSAYAEVHEVDHYPVPTPTLLVRGDQDAPKALAEIYGNLCATNPSARQVVLPGTGHVPMLDQPDEFNRVLEGFVAGLPTTGDS